VLVDDHEVVRMGLRTLLEHAGFAVAGEAGTMMDAIRVTDHARPDVVIMDVRLPDGSGVEACREIRAQHPDIRVIMLTSYADEDAAFASILAGASGFLLKQVRSSSLVEAIRTVGGGGSLLDPAVAEHALARVRKLAEQPGTDDPVTKLSEQERKLLAYIAEGKTNKEIAQAMHLSDKTVRNYVSNILSKLHLSRRSEAAAFAARRNLTRGDLKQ